jgi:hypothetical protein
MQSRPYVLFVALALAACSKNYIYRPTVTTTSATVAGLPASYYGVPPESPRGHVRIATLGFADIRPAGGGEQEDVPALHVRMIVANNSDRPWQLDTREARAILPRRGESRPAYATVDQGTPPVVEIPARAERTVDLFYPLPRDMQKEDSVPSFDVLWQIDTDARRVVERTPFERIEVETPSESSSPDTTLTYFAWGGPYWGDPYYAQGGAFVGVAPVYVERPVIIRRRVYVAPPAVRGR